MSFYQNKKQKIKLSIPNGGKHTTEGAYGLPIYGKPLICWWPLYFCPKRSCSNYLQCSRWPKSDQQARPEI